MGIPLIALAGRQPDIIDPLTQRTRGAQLKNLLGQNAMIPGQQQLQQQQIQAQQQQLDQQKAINDAYKEAYQQGPDGKATLDRDKLTTALMQGGHGSAVPSIVEGFTKMDQAHATYQEAQNKIKQAETDYLGTVADTIRRANYDPNAANLALDHAAQANPQYKPQIAQLQQQMQQNPQQFKQIVDQVWGASTKQRELATAQETADARMKAAQKQPEGEMPLPNIDQMNKALANRYAVANPGKQVPPEYQLPPNATQKEYDRLNASLSATENAAATKAARDAAAAQRDLANQERASNKQDKQEKDDIQPVIGRDQNGKEVLVSMSKAKELGLNDITKADADLFNKSHAARTWLQLAGKTGGNSDDPSSMGLVQLVDKLDKAGKLGVVASRWNDFMSGKLGAGDPDFTALRTKLGLSTTKLMQAHVGSRGGAFMMEHFEDLANAKKMNASTLKQGILSEMNYMKDVAMLPDGEGGATNSGGASLPSFKDWKASKQQ